MTPRAELRDALYRLLDALCSADAVSACEGELRSRIAREVEGSVDSVETDALGNLIASRAPAGPRRLLFAYMDEPGFVVTHVGSDGLLHVAAVGELSAEAALGCRVRLEGGALGVVVAEGRDHGSIDVSDLRIDVGATSRDEARRVAPAGTRAAFEGPAHRRGDVAIGKAIESRLGCAVVIEVLKRSRAEGLCAVFAAQERLGGRGMAALAGGGRRFDEAVGVSLVDAAPKGSETSPVELGSGPALVVQDGAHIADPRLFERLAASAERGGVAVQRCVSKSGAKGAGFLQRAPGGTPLAVVGIPARNVSGLLQIANLSDAAGAVELLVRWADGE